MMRRAFAVVLVFTGIAAVGMAIGYRRQFQPRVAIVIVVDQLRADLLDRYDDLFGGGFRRLRDEGFRFTNATHDHWWTETAPGHTALATGTYPAHHGVVMNSFSVWETEAFESVYSFADSASPIIDMPDLPGRSPVNMRRPSFAEWLVAHDTNARIATVSRKDRGAIPLAGRTRATALWLDIESGRFVTSTYYAAQYPDWVNDFNARTMPFLYSDSVWSLLVPPHAVSRARPDSADYENGGRDVTFPHAAWERAPNQSFNAWMAETPAPDVATLLLARRMMEELDLGRQDHVDFLGISLSQTDAIGHNWGPLSLEQLDNLLRIDRALGEFMDFLDEHVGSDRWVLALSADHGVMTAPEYLTEQGVDAVRLSREQSRTLNAMSAELSGVTDEATRADLISRIEAMPLVGDVVTLQDLRRAPAPADTFVTLLRNSYVPDRGSRALLGPPELLLRGREYVLSARTDAASHGSPYHYDRHVPLVFMGPRIAAGSSDERAATVDLAPTLAELLEVPLPDGLDGVSRAAVLRR